MGNQCRDNKSIQTNYLDESQGYPQQIERSVQEVRKNVATDQQLSLHQLGKTKMFRGRLEDGKKIGYGQYFDNKHAYYGQFSDDIPHGRGILIINQQDYFKGHFKKGKPHGEGYQKIGSIQFQGRYYKGTRRKGTLKTPLCKYDGEFSNDKYEGIGTLILNSGQVYEGQFKNGLFHGIGKYATSNGIYNGNFECGKYSGKGLYRWNDGAFYDGQYEQGIRDGYGRFVKDKFSYEGQWKNGLFLQRQRGNDETS